MQDEVKVTQADRGVFGEVLACLSTANELRAAKDCNQAQQAIFWEQKALSVLARHRHQAERETLARMEPVAWSDVVAERQRQIEKEGWSHAHDDAYECGQMAGAAVCYALANAGHWAAGPAIDKFWPWDKAWWKPTDKRRNLVKAAALLLAEIERIDRTRFLSKPEEA